MAGTVLFAGSSETATLTVTFTVTDSAGTSTPTDPGAVTVTVTDPLGTSSTYTSGTTPAVQKSSTGSYWLAITTPTPGEWSYTWTGTAPVPDVQHGSFSVQETNLGHLYVTPQMLRSRVGLQPGDTSSDLELHSACYAASRALEAYCQRTFWRTLPSEVRTFEAADVFRLDLGPWNDLVVATQIRTDLDADGVFEVTWPTGDYVLEPVNSQAGPERRPYTSIRAIGASYLPTQFYPRYWGRQYGRLDRVEITGVFGWPAVPAAISEAARILAASLFKAKDAPFGIASFGEYGAVRVREDPMVARLAGPYCHAGSWVT